MNDAEDCTHFSNIVSDVEDRNVPWGSSYKQQTSVKSSCTACYLQDNVKLQSDTTNEAGTKTWPPTNVTESDQWMSLLPSPHSCLY